MNWTRSGKRRRGPLPERFWAKVDTSGECWEWQAFRDPNDYGRFEKRLASRVAYELTNGAIAQGLHVLHSCDNPPCCNPAHLFLGTHADNMHDMAVKGRTHFHGGNSQNRAKVTEGQVREIRVRYVRGAPIKALAREYGLMPHQFRRIATGGSWRHVK